MNLKVVRLVCILLLLGSFAFAQKHEIGVLAGGHFPSDAAVDTNTGLAFQGVYAGRIIHVPLASLYVEVPVTGTLRTDVIDEIRTAQAIVRPQNYSAFYVTPGLKLKLAPEFPVSPYFVAGGGFVHYRTVLQTVTESGAETGSTRGVFDFGAGVDFKVLPFFSLRGEIRDFYSGRPTFSSLPDFKGRQHNIFAGGGLVFRF